MVTEWLLFNVSRCRFFWGGGEDGGLPILSMSLCPTQHPSTVSYLSNKLIKDDQALISTYVFICFYLKLTCSHTYEGIHSRFFQHFISRTVHVKKNLQEHKAQDLAFFVIMPQDPAFLYNCWSNLLMFLHIALWKLLSFAYDLYLPLLCHMLAL